MSEIINIDKNFHVKTAITKTDINVYDVCNAPFCVYGLIPPKKNNDVFRRMPLENAYKVSKGVELLHTNTAGGRVTFKTDSPYIAIHAEYGNVAEFSHMPLTGIAGFDLYKKQDGVEIFVNCFIPPFDIGTRKILESEYLMNESKMEEYVLYFPLYSDIKKLYIILEDSAEIKAARVYSNKKPVVFYGSSITQGGCASRPGNSYESIVSRCLNLDYINLGFSGSAKGEIEMATYIADIPMSLFVYDYDHNAPDTKYLKNTYEAFFNEIRYKNPLLPVVCISKPFGKYDEDMERREIIKEYVEKWRSNGDKNVYFVDGYSFRELFNAGDSIVVDGCHPNDLGFWCMAKKIEIVIREIIQ